MCSHLPQGPFDCFHGKALGFTPRFGEARDGRRSQSFWGNDLGAFWGNDFGVWGLQDGYAGFQGGQSAFAVGYQHAFNNNRASVSVTGSFSNGETSAGVGAGLSW